ncbi:MAG: hypothetical protein CVU15_11170 [Betaproteobacteria bacterium HGW-Betaproteobacteria-1]|jgi:hypothetical protein|nr:MAG: hypothetical protein CVU15_11170 [Betaproteobacteria bacterium HGW-Betaproteobacteria-1]
MRILIRIICILSVVWVWPALGADFDAQSRFTPNPQSGVGRFVFDLEMRVTLRSTQASGPFTVLVNSRDGSMVLDNPHITLWALGMPDVPGLQIHHVLYRPGNLMACGIHSQTGEVCLPLGASDWVATIMPALSELNAEHFFASARESDQTAAPCCLPEARGLEHLRGQGRDGSWISFWFDPGISTTPTQVPFLGPGVGVIKDQIARKNRVVRHIHVMPVGTESFEMHLDHLSGANRSLDLSRFRVVSAFTTTGLSEANDLSAWIMASGREIQALSREMAEVCAKGRAGNDCRAEYRVRIKALEHEIKMRALGYGAAHGLPGVQE